MSHCTRFFEGKKQKTKVKLPTSQVKRLSRTCFRNKEPLAGNFALWGTFDEMMNDPIIAEMLTNELAAIDFTTHNESSNVRVQLEYPNYVGWSSVCPIKGVSTSDLERFELSGEGKYARHAWQFKDKTQKAPQTRFITIVLHVNRRHKKDLPLISGTIQTMYPGRDLGPLRGDQDGNVSRNLGVAFYDWQNPGSFDDMWTDE